MLKDALQDTWKFFRIHYIALSAIILPIVIPADILVFSYQHLVQDKENSIYLVIPIMFKLIINPLYSVGVIFYIAYIIKGEILDKKAAWLLGIKYWTPYFVLSVLVSTLTLAGLMMLIIPGILFVVRFSFSEFDLLLQNAKPVDAMKNSWQLTRYFMVELFAGFAIISLVLFVPYFIVLSSMDTTTSIFKVFDIVTTIIYSVLQVFYTIFAFRIYDYAREEQNKVFDR